jgi:hypothetical protein
VTGLVLSYRDAAGRGVLPGSIVTIAGTTMSATTDAFGRFTLANVPAGHVLVNVTHPTDKTASLAYGTTQLAVDVAAGQTVQVFPVLHSGCYVSFNVGQTTDASTFTLQQGCISRSNAYAAITLSGNTGEIVDPTTSAPYNANARVEIIPLAFPTDEPTDPDLSFGIGMPGNLASSSGVAIDPIGGAEIRIVKDTSDSADGSPLQLAQGQTVSLDLPLYRAGTGAEPLAAWSYDAKQGAWVLDPSATGGTFTTVQQQFNVYRVTVSHLSWWSVSQPRATTGCVTGKLTAGGAPAAGVVVRGLGSSYLGATTTMTTANGTFCLDGVGEQSVSIVAGYAASATAAFTTNAGPFTTSTTGSCATQATACAQVGTIAMDGWSPTCTLATITRLSTTGSPVTTALDVFGDYSNNLTFGQQQAGVLSLAYVGVVQPSNAGAVCIPTPAAPGAQLHEHTKTICAGSGQVDDGVSFNVTPDAGVGACSGTTCLDAGTLAYTCHVP